MAVKTITIDMEAYALLARRKTEGQQPTAARFRDLVRSAHRSRLSEDALEAIESSQRFSGRAGPSPPWTCSLPRRRFSTTPRNVRDFSRVPGLRVIDS